MDFNPGYISVILAGVIVILLGFLYLIYRVGKKHTEENSSNSRAAPLEMSPRSPACVTASTISKSNGQRYSSSSAFRCATTDSSVVVVDISDSGVGGGCDSGGGGGCDSGGGGEHIPAVGGSGGVCDSGSGGIYSSVVGGSGGACDSGGGGGGHSSGGGGGHSYSGGGGGHSYSGGGGGCDSGGGGGGCDSGGGGCDSGGGGSYD